MKSFTSHRSRYCFLNVSAGFAFQTIGVNPVDGHVQRQKRHGSGEQKSTRKMSAERLRGDTPSGQKAHHPWRSAQQIRQRDIQQTVQQVLDPDCQ